MGAKEIIELRKKYASNMFDNEIEQQEQQEKKTTSDIVNRRTKTK